MALFGANYLFTWVTSSACLSSRRHRADCWLYRSGVFASDPGVYGLGKAEELFGEEISEEDKETEENEMTAADLAEYVLKTK